MGDEGKRKRQTLEGEDCSVCFEAMTASEETRGLLTFCCACGHNFHKDCIRRWQSASSGDCPLCRQPWQHPLQNVAPGESLPQRQPQVVNKRGSGYLNLNVNRRSSR